MSIGYTFCLIVTHIQQKLIQQDTLCKHRKSLTSLANVNLTGWDEIKLRKPAATFTAYMLKQFLSKWNQTSPDTAVATSHCELDKDHQKTHQTQFVCIKLDHGNLQLMENYKNNNHCNVISVDNNKVFIILISSQSICKSYTCKKLPKQALLNILLP